MKSVTWTTCFLGDRYDENRDRILSTMPYDPTAFNNLRRDSAKSLFYVQKDY